MPAFRDDPPAFEDASAADNINRLIKEAIVVKDLLASSVAAVQQVDAAAKTEFAKGLKVVDQVSYFALETYLPTYSSNGIDQTFS